MPEKQYVTHALCPLDKRKIMKITPDLKPCDMTVDAGAEASAKKRLPVPFIKLLSFGHNRNPRVLSKTLV